MLNQLDNIEDDILHMGNIRPNYYADGGMVANDQRSPLMASMGQNTIGLEGGIGEEGGGDYKSLAEMIRRQGEGNDTILAHINEDEANMLGQMNGGTINPVTGLPQFGLLTNPKKWFKSVAGPAAGAIIGNMILPGIGGVIGGAFGGPPGSIARGRNDMGQAMLRGGAMGAMLPSAASLAGSGATSLGFKGAGASLSNYGAQNAILPSIGLGNLAGSSSAAAAASANQVPVSEIVAKEAAQTAAKEAAEQSFGDMLLSNSKSFFSKPSNLLTAAIVGGSLMNRPKPPREKSPEELAAEKKRYEMALMLTPEEQAAKEAADLAAEQSRRRIARNKFLPEERFNIDPLYVKTNSPADYKKKGRWLEYYNNPQFSGAPIAMKHGGKVGSLGMYISGATSGQDDKIPAMLSDGEYVIPADTVAHLGDGNNNAGARKLDSMIAKIRYSKGLKNSLPPKAKSLHAYMGV